MEASIGIGESLLISLVGMFVVMLELFLLYIFVGFLAKTATSAAKKRKKTEHETLSYSVSASSEETVTEMAAALAAAFAEAGVTPEATQTLIIDAVKTN